MPKADGNILIKQDLGHAGRQSAGRPDTLDGQTFKQSAIASGEYPS
jgi:hypothetical protein